MSLNRLVSICSAVSYWIPTDEPPQTLQDATLTAVYENITENERVYHFTIRGPHHMGVFLSPADGMQMVNWTYLENTVPESGPQWQNERDTYFIFFNYGDESSNEFQFSVTIYAHENGPESSSWVDIALVSHYLFHKEHRTEAFQSFIDSFPEWTYCQAWMSTYESWKF